VDEQSGRGMSEWALWWLSSYRPPLSHFRQGSFTLCAKPSARPWTNFHRFGIAPLAHASVQRRGVDRLADTKEAADSVAIQQFGLHLRLHVCRCGMLRLETPNVHMMRRGSVRNAGIPSVSDCSVAGLDCSLEGL